MSRKMYVTDDMGEDDALIEMAEHHLLNAMMWAWIIPFFDDWGRARADAKRIKGKIFPYFDRITYEHVESALIAFADKGLIVLYDVNGTRYMAIEPEKWFTYQTHIHKDKRANDGSKLPPCPLFCASQNVMSEREEIVTNATSRGKSRKIAENRASLTPSLTLTPSVYGAPEDGAPPKEGVATEQPAEDDNARTKRFVPPAVEEVEAYFAERGHPGHSQAFYDHHQARGWYLSNRKRMSDWKAAVRMWVGNIPKFSNGGYGSDAKRQVPPAPSTSRLINPEDIKPISFARKSAA